MSSQLNQFIDSNADNDLCKTLYKKMVEVHYHNGKTGMATRWVSDGNHSDETSIRSKCKTMFVGLETSAGTTIDDVDYDHFIKRVGERHPNLNDLVDTLKNPQRVVRGSNDDGSTVYIGDVWYVVVVDHNDRKGSGTLKTVFTNPYHSAKG